jgi:hypothetical protein
MDQISTRNNSHSSSSEKAPTSRDSAESIDFSEVSHHFQNRKKKKKWFCIIVYLLVFISFLLSFLVLQIVKNRKEFKEKWEYNHNSDLFKNGRLPPNKV